ncbi:MAG: RNA methyltransferase [Sphingobacteriaceae bacterium]|nr:MAG: RNA methyltransferase [Pedobacter sp.]
MLSKSQISFVKSLHKKKFRKEWGLFIAEGIKSVVEFAQSNYVIDSIFYTTKDALKMGILSQKVKLVEIKEEELEKISTLTKPQQVLAIIRIPDHSTGAKIKLADQTFTLILDNLQDPGNLGTIIRTADWFGFKQLICSPDTVEAYNPKVIQASMGSLSRVQVLYTDLLPLLGQCPLPIYGALLDGKPIGQTSFPAAGVLVLGNEGNGISDEVRQYIQHSVTIPRYGGAESLNVALSAAIFCMKIRNAF